VLDSREWLCISAVASVLGLFSLLLIYRQLRETRVWNKLHFTYTFFPDPLEFAELEIFLDDRIAFWKRDSPLTELEVRALIGKEKLRKKELKTLSKSFCGTANQEDAKAELYEAGRKLKIYINQVESYCAAINSGIIDSNTAKQVYAYKFKRAYEKALPWINKLRSMKHEDSIYIELVNVLNRWFPTPKGQQNKY